MSGELKLPQFLSWRVARFSLNLLNVFLVVKDEDWPLVGLGEATLRCQGVVKLLFEPLLDSTALDTLAAEAGVVVALLATVAELFCMSFPEDFLRFLLVSKLVGGVVVVDSS